jgi:hypothetical protein
MLPLSVKCFSAYYHASKNYKSISMELKCAVSTNTDLRCFTYVKQNFIVSRRDHVNEC